MKKFDERSPLLSPLRKSSFVEDEENWLEDAVTVGMWRLCGAWTFMFAMWYISFLVRAGEIIYQQYLHVSFIARISVVFLPMWFGSIVGIIMIAIGTKNLCGCHKNLRVVSKGYKALLRHNGEDTRGLICYDSLPLLRFYYLWSTLSILGVLCVVISQVLWYLWLEEGAVGMWNACIPVAIVVLVAVVYGTLVKSVSALTGACLLLACSWLTLLAIKLQDSSPTEESVHGSLSWQIVAAPLVVLQVILSVKLIGIASRYCRGSLQVLSGIQGGIWVAYSLASAVSAWCLWSTRNSSSSSDALVSHAEMVAHPAARCWVVIITLLFLGIVTTLRLECQHLTHTKGFSTPIPLVKNAIGTFEPSQKFTVPEFSIIGTVLSTTSCPSTLSYEGTNIEAQNSSKSHSKYSGAHQIASAQGERGYDSSVMAPDQFSL